MLPRRHAIPIQVKLAFTAFMAVLVPFYWITYGPSNFLFFCDVALFLTLFAVWTENKLLVSLPAVGIILPQLLWVLDYGCGLLGFHPLGLTAYMFDTNIPVFARGLSLFHGWLPFLLVYLVYKTGYDKRALLLWTLIAWVLLSVCYFFMPAPGAVLANPNAPVNINYVFGLNADNPQTWFHPHVYFSILIVGLPAIVYYPTHKLLEKFFGKSV